MKNLRLLNNIKLLIILFFLLFTFESYSEEEPADIWNVDTEQQDLKETENKKIEEKSISQNSIFKIQSQNKDELIIEENQTLTSNEVKIVGLYDPAENGLDINMWSNSDGEQILRIFKRINKINLSQDATEILDILLVTNAYYPKLNITKEQFLKIKSDWLIKNSNLKLIEDYLLKNQIINENPKLTRYLVDYYLSRSEINKSCEIFSKIQSSIEDEYLSKFNIYCLINNNEREVAQLQFDLKKELGFEDNFFEKKFNYLMEYDKTVDEKISEKSILDFHLSHRTNPEFEFEPVESTSKYIWRYLSTSNLLDNIESIDLEDQNKITLIEKATHEGNYNEKELYNLYKRFLFNINQLLSVKQSYKLLSNVEARALLYQGILINSQPETKLELVKILKDLFIKEGIENAFKDELIKILKEINIEENQLGRKYKKLVSVCSLGASNLHEARHTNHLG